MKIKKLHKKLNKLLKKCLKSKKEIEINNLVRKMDILKEHIYFINEFKEGI